MNMHIVPQHFLGNDVKTIVEQDRKVIGSRLDLFNILGVLCRSHWFVHQQSPADGLHALLPTALLLASISSCSVCHHHGRHHHCRQHLDLIRISQSKTVNDRFCLFVCPHRRVLVLDNHVQPIKSNQTMTQHSHPTDPWLTG